MVLDPIEVAGHTGEGSWQLLLAAGRGAEGGQTDLNLVGSEHQGAARVAVAGGNGSWGRHTDVGGADGGAIGLHARCVRDDLHVSVLQMGSNAAGRVGGAAPAGGDDLIINVAGVVGLLAGQVDGTNGVAVIHMRNTDQGDVVQQSPGVPALVDDDVILADAVLNLGGIAVSAAQMDIDGVDTKLRKRDKWKFSRSTAQIYPSVQ